MQKPPCGVGEKRFQDKFSAAPAALVEIPVGLRTRPAWWLLDKTAAAMVRAADTLWDIRGGHDPTVTAAMTHRKSPRVCKTLQLVRKLKSRRAFTGSAAIPAHATATTMVFPADSGLIFLTDELTNDRFLVDTEAT
jgi:hypothetical protein